MEIKEKKSETIKTKAKRKLSKLGSVVTAAALSLMGTVNTVFADDPPSGGTPSGGGAGNSGSDPGGFASDMLGYAWWVIIAIVGIFAAMGLVKAVQGQSEEDVRARNNGIATLVISGAAIVIVLLIKGQTT